jgi:NADPH-dependent glutamate synthase beta subunit-like oxidoreductase/ferredoxin
MKITIDHITVEVSPGTTILQAARSMGLEIPALCYLDGHSNHPSCFVCLVEEEDSGRLVPSCAMSAEEGMAILTDSPAAVTARKEALELLLSEHVGDCEAPCQRSCPAGMNIPLMNRLISTGKLHEALSVVREEIALPLVLGYICPAPCEKACRRKAIDAPVQICMLKRFTAQDKEIRYHGLNPNRTMSGKRIAVIGTGPAGLAAAFHSLRLGHEVVLFEKADLPGGALRYAIPDDLLPKDKLDADIEVIRWMGGHFELKTHVNKNFFENKILNGFHGVILATGFTEEHPADDFSLVPVAKNLLVDRKLMTTSRPGVFGCGSLISEQLLSVRSVDQGKKAAFSAHYFMMGTTSGKIHPGVCSVMPVPNEEELSEYLKESSADPVVDPAGGYLTGYTAEEASREARRCLHCDCRKPVSCKLRKYAAEYEADRRRYLGPERKIMIRQVQHDLVIWEPEKCIKCGLCVSITKVNQEPLGLAFVRRGFDVGINVPFGESLRAGLTTSARECVTACPTGALALKDMEENLGHIEQK